MPVPEPVHTRAVLLRHAQSLWNLENRFTGWQDVDLSPTGIEEAHRAGRLIRDHGFTFDRAFVSTLKRTTHTLDIVMHETGQTGITVERSWLLNERHYGALEGLDKKETAARYGDEQFQRWRRGYAERPPALTPHDTRHPRHSEHYAEVDPDQLPSTESLADTTRRVVEYWQTVIVPCLVRGKTILVVSHGNTLRGLVKHLDRLSDPEVERLEIPTGAPIVYEFNANAEPLRHYYLKAAPASAA